MLDNAKKKVIKIYSHLPNFFKEYLPHIVFLVFTYQLLSFLNTLPYINIINKYYYYVFALLWVFANFLFKKTITNRRILISGIMMFVIAIIPVILEQDYAGDILGFVAYLFIFSYVIRQLISERTELSQE